MKLCLFFHLTLVIVFISVHFFFHVLGRPAQNFGDPMGDRIPPNAWHPMSPPNVRPPSNADIRGFGGQLLPRSGDMALPLNPVIKKIDDYATCYYVVFFP